MPTGHRVRRPGKGHLIAACGAALPGMPSDRMMQQTLRLYPWARVRRRGGPCTLGCPLAEQLHRVDHALPQVERGRARHLLGRVRVPGQWENGPSGRPTANEAADSRTRAPRVRMDNRPGWVSRGTQGL